VFGVDIFLIVSVPKKHFPPPFGGIEGGNTGGGLFSTFFNAFVLF
jgi:hypothetical protein